MMTAAVGNIVQWCEMGDVVLLITSGRSTVQLVLCGGGDSCSTLYSEC